MSTVHRNEMSEQNARYEQQRRIEASRARKAERLVEALMLSCHGTVPSVEVMAALDDEGWAALEAVAGTRKASAETRTLVLARLAQKRRHAKSTEDPFAAFPRAV